MPAKTGSRNGLSYGWALGENNWNTGMDGNLTFIDRFGVHLSFKSFLNTPPGSPAAGDCHVIDTAPTGAWVGKAGQVAVYDDGAWRYGVPRTGWRAYCEADERPYVYDGGWAPAASEWTATKVTQAEAEEGTGTTDRKWDALRVRQAIAAWWLTASSAFGRTLANVADAAAGRTALDLGNVDNTSDANKPVSTAQQAALNGKEPTITAGTSAQFWRGDKTWADFAANVRTTVLTGLSTASAAVVTAADSVLGAIGKLQAQISDVVTQTDAEAGTATAIKAWTSLRVRQAIAAWWSGVTTIDGKAIGTTTRSTGKFTLVDANAGLIVSGGAGNVVTGLNTFQYSSAGGTIAKVFRTYNTTTGTVSVGVGARSTATTLDSMAAYDLGFYVVSNSIVAAGATQSGYMRAGEFSVLRNGPSVPTQDDGTLSAMQGVNMAFGHYNTNAAASPTTTSITGLSLVPYLLTGTCAALYGININGIGGTPANAAAASAMRLGFSSVAPSHRNIDASGTAYNYLNGNTGIGVQPSSSAKLDVAGPLRHGQYTLSTLPSAAAFSGCLIDVTNATGGPKTCRSNGTDWCLINTTTPVS